MYVAIFRAKRRIKNASAMLTRPDILSALQGYERARLTRATV